MSRVSGVGCRVSEIHQRPVCGFSPTPHPPLPTPRNSTSGSHHHEIRQVRFELRRRVGNDDRVLVADGFAEPACHALFLVDESDLVVVGHRLVVRVDHLDALERTDVDAELASRTKLLDDLGLRDLFRLDPGDEVAVLILDRVDRTIDAADGAVDTALRMDVVQAAGRSPNGVGGALHLADAATNALVGDEMRHGRRVYLTSATIARSLMKSGSMMRRSRWKTPNLGAARSPIQKNAPAGE